MASRLRSDKPLGKQVSRFASEELGAVVQGLSKKPDGLHKSVHEARRSFKRVRGLCQLVQAADAGFFRKMRSDIGALGQLLSPLRDATAIVESCSRQQAFAFRDDTAAAFQRFMTHLSALQVEATLDEASLQAIVNQVVVKAQLYQTQFDLLRLELDPGKAARILRKGWRKTLEKGQSAVEACEDKPGTDAFHDLRKAAQAHVQQTNLLMDLWPSVLLPRQREAKSIADLLGEDHDLCLLHDKIADDEQFRNDRYLLETSIQERQTHLRMQAMAKARALFSLNSDFEANRIALMWRHDAHREQGVD